MGHFWTGQSVSFIRIGPICNFFIDSQSISQLRIDNPYATYRLWICKPITKGQYENYICLLGVPAKQMMYVAISIYILGVNMASRPIQVKNCALKVVMRG